MKLNMLLETSAIGQSLSTVVAGRIVSGVGGAGMSLLVSIIITGKYRNGAFSLCTPSLARIWS
jgi:hypothetical protein